jgi:hypothetical protein
MAALLINSCTYAESRIFKPDESTAPDIERDRKCSLPFAFARFGFICMHESAASQPASQNGAAIATHTQRELCMRIYAVVIIVIMAIVRGVPFHINELVFSLHYLFSVTVEEGTRSNIQVVQVQADFASLCLFNLG